MAEEQEESLKEILKPSTGEKTAPPAETKARDESGKFTKPQEKPAEPPASVEPAVEVKPTEKPVDKPKIDVSALIDERRKRQAAEEELKKLRSQTPEKAPSVFEDEGKAISHHLDAGTRPLRESLFNQSVKIARLLYKDSFEEAQTAFVEASQKDERLIEALRRSDDPGEFIYTTGIQLKELGEVGGDFVKYREKLTGDAKAQIAERDARIKTLEEQLAQASKTQTELAAVPRSLNTRSAAPKGAELEPEEDIASIARFNQRKNG